MKIQIAKIFLIFFLPLINLAQTQFLSPIDNSRFHNPETTIILRQGSEYLIQNIDESYFEIIGERSGKHEFQLVFSSDAKTIILKPNKNFDAGEKVSWAINRPIVFKGGEIEPFSACFYISEKDLRIKDLPLDAATKSNIPENFPDFYITKDSGFFDAPLFFYNISAFATNNDRFMSIMEKDSSFIYYKQENNKGLNFSLQLDNFITYWGAQQFMVMDSTYCIVDSFSCGNGYNTDWHEFILLPGNHGFVFSYDDQSFDMTQYLPTGQSDAVVEGLVIQEIDSLKNVIFQWRSWDYYEVTDATQTNFEADYISYVHGNAMDICNDGNLLLSARLMDEITKINRNSGEIIWRFGGKNNMFDFLDNADSVTFNRQHDIQELSNGNLTLYDNGEYHDVQRSYAKEYLLDTVAMTAQLVWAFQHPDKNYGSRMGSVQRLPNGNTLICWGLLASLSNDITEVDSLNNIVYEFNILPLGQYIYRARKFEWAHFPNSINEIIGTNSVINIFPNPAIDEINFMIENLPVDNYDVFIYDISGKIFFEAGKIRNDELFNLKINVSHFAKGLYLISLRNARHNYYSKFIR